MQIAEAVSFIGSTIKLPVTYIQEQKGKDVTCLIISGYLEGSMKKRGIAFLLCILLGTAVFTGCNKDISDIQASDPDITTGSVKDENGAPQITPEAAVQPDTPDKASGEAAGKDSYAYLQDLNMIDDNYRNYYEIFVYSFYDSDGDGIGDLNGVITKLDYISDMGFNGIWLMPVMPSDTYHKYDVKDYYSIDPEYGTLEDFQKLLEECHSRGIRVIIDYVFNHTSTKHEWFRQAVAYLSGLKAGEEPDLMACPYAGYYHFTAENPDNGKYYRAGSSDYYYEAVFWDRMPDLALENKELRAELENITRYWLDMGVDGFRLDAVKEYYTGETGKNVEVLRWFTEYVRSVKEDAFVVGECWDTASVIASYYESGIQSIFNYPLAQYNGLIVSSIRKLGSANASTFQASLLRLEEQYKQKNPDYIDSPFVSNHDNTRISAQCVNDPKLMKMAAGVLLTMKGSPFVYYGEEIGMNSKGDKDENKRLPMNWSVADLTGITKPPQGADTVEQRFAALDEQLNDPLSIVNYYKRALRIRNENPEIARGDISGIASLATENICAVKKVHEGSELVIIYNMSEETETLELRKADMAELNIRGYLTADGSEVILKGGILELPMYSIVILK